MEQTIVEKAYRYFAPTVEGLGYEVVEIEFKVLYGNPTLTIYIDCPEGISLTDCEAVNTALDVPAEQYDISDGKPYHLNISSPGLDRPIVTERDYERNRGREVEVHLIKKMDKKNKIIGILNGQADGSAIITVGETEVKIPKDNIKVMHQYIQF